MRRAISLISGGLDSSLATLIVARQGIDVFGLSFSSPFFGVEAARLVSIELGIPFKVIDLSHHYLELLKNPRYGFGKNMNPCIDCHILMLKEAGGYMLEVGGDFIITGEVLGSRPKSQSRRALEIIQKESGQNGLVLRPLSARLLSPTLPEIYGWVRRDALLDIHGRSRKRQLALAKKFGITRFSQPAGGCLLTDPAFSRRLRDLLHHTTPTIKDLEILRYGRHFRLSEKTKLIVGRNEDENKNLVNLLQDGDLILMVNGYKGPVTIMRGEIDNLLIIKAASICARYSDARYLDRVRIELRSVSGSREGGLSVSPREAKELGAELL